MQRGKEASYFFVDQYNSEFNRCVQPMRGGYTAPNRRFNYRFIWGK